MINFGIISDVNINIQMNVFRRSKRYRDVKSYWKDSVNLGFPEVVVHLKYFL